MIVYTPPRPAGRIPLIDLAGSFDDGARRAEVAWEIHKACRETGFFYVAGHGVAPALLDRQLDEARRFFAQPDGLKAAVAVSRSSCRRGYEGAGAQVLDPGSPADLKESFMLAVELGPDHRHVRAGLPNQGSNLWPDGLPGFRPQMQVYEAEMIRLGRHLIGLLAVSVELDYRWFDDGLAEPQCGVRLLHYPPQPAAAATNLLGAGAHTDWGSITILLQDTVGGLEVLNAAGEWITAPPVDGTLIVNLGQMMERFTGGLYRANLHRVRNASPTRDRYSVATFFELDPTYRMGRAPTCPATEPLPDPPPTIGEHIEAMARASYGG